MIRRQRIIGNQIVLVPDMSYSIVKRKGPHLLVSKIMSFLSKTATIIYINIALKLLEYANVGFGTPS